jgi:hypothetical protein
MEIVQKERLEVEFVVARLFFELSSARSSEISLGTVGFRLQTERGNSIEQPISTISAHQFHSSHYDGRLSRNSPSKSEGIHSVIG